MGLGEPPVLPSLRLPEPLVLPRPVLDVPRADIPSYKPLVVPPRNLRPPPGVKGTTPSEKEKPKPQPPPVKPPDIPQDTRKVDIPFTDVTMPLPSTKYLSRLVLLPPCLLQPPLQQQQCSNTL